MYEIQAKVTDPSDEIALRVYHPWGDFDVFHVGHVTRSMGASYDCHNEDGWEEIYSKSPTAASVNSILVKHPFLINTDETRNKDNADNWITFKIPVYALNVDTVEDGVTRQIAMELLISDTHQWASVQDLTIGAYAAPPASVAPTLIGSPVIINDLTATNGKVIAGDAIVFRVELEIPAGQWANFDVEMTGDQANGVFAIGATIHNGGLAAYFPPAHVVSSEVSDTVTVDFGDVQNVDASSPTRVFVDLAFAVDENTNTVSRSLTGTMTIGGTNVGPLNFDVLINSAPASPVVTATDYFDTDLRVWGQVGLDLEVELPSSSGGIDMTFEAISEATITAYSLRLCRVRLQPVGVGLPCVKEVADIDLHAYSMSDPSRPFDDLGEIDIPRFCPFNNPDGDADSNKFVANLIYELPYQAAITAEPYDVSGGLKINDVEIHMATRQFNINPADFTGLGIQYDTPRKCNNSK